jgi:flagellin
MLTINTNIISLMAENNLSTTQSSLGTSMQRLSSGLRINSAKDDAAGLAITDQMTAQINGLDQAGRNANDGISLAQTADGALQSITNNLQTIRQLAVQSANATNSATDRADLQTEAASLLQEIDRVANTTQFNNVKLLDGSFTGATFQVGANANDTITVASLTDANTSALSSVTSANSQSLSVTGITNLAAVGPGALVINGVDVGASIGAAGTSQQRVSQVVDAINNYATSTGVNAAFDASTGHITLSSGSNIVVTGNDLGDATGFASAVGQGSATAATTTGLTGLSLSSFSGATLAIQQIDSALQQIDTARANLGAVENRFSSVVSNNSSMENNLSSSRSQIQDTDFAKETANMTRAQILQQAGVAMLAQANQVPQTVLKLLG